LLLEHRRANTLKRTEEALEADTGKRRNRWEHGPERSTVIALKCVRLRILAADYVAESILAVIPEA
jgi:hypothetical protein